MLSVSRAGRTEQDVANIFGHTSHLLHLQRLGQPGLLIGTRLSLSPSLPSRLILTPDCLLFRLKLRPTVLNWSNCNRSCWKTAKIWWKSKRILKKGFWCWRMTLRRVKMSFWGQRRSWRGLNRNLRPLRQKPESRRSCRFVDSNPYLGELLAPSSLNQSHQNTTTQETCSIYLRGFSPSILQVCQQYDYNNNDSYNYTHLSN